MNERRAFGSAPSFAAALLLAAAPSSEASRFAPPFHVAWDKAPIIVIGMLGTPATMKEARTVSGGKTTWSRGPTAAYPLDTWKFFRGSKPRGKRMFVIDHSYSSSASLRVSGHEDESVVRWARGILSREGAETE